MKLHEIDPTKRYVLTLETTDIAQEDLKTMHEYLKARGLDNVTIVVGPVSESDSPRYWGIWVSSPEGKPDWVHWANGQLLYYPSPAIAKEHMIGLGWEHASVKEFTLADVLEVP